MYCNYPHTYKTSSHIQECISASYSPLLVLLPSLSASEEDSAGRSSLALACNTSLPETPSTLALFSFAVRDSPLLPLFLPFLGHLFSFSVAASFDLCKQNHVCLSEICIRTTFKSFQCREVSASIDKVSQLDWCYMARQQSRTVSRCWTHENLSCLWNVQAQSADCVLSRDERGT